MITVQLPNGQTVTVQDTNDPQAAAAAARRYFQSSDPEGFAAFQRSLPISGFGRAAVQGFRGTVGSLPEGAGIIAGAIGLPGEETLRGIGEAITGETPADTRAPDLQDFLEQPFAASRALLGSGLGSVAGFLATGVGAGLLARTIFGLGARGATAGAAQTAGRLGTVGGIAGAGALASTSELEEGLLAENVEPERARALAASLGPLIGVAETANLAGLARRVLGRELTEEAAREIAQRGMLSAMGRRGGREAFLEALTEGGGETARQGVIAAETGNLNAEERFAAIALGTIAGGLAGGAIGAPGGLIERGAARQQIAQIDAARQPPTPPSTEPPPPVDVGPQPITTEDAAREYLFGASTDPETLRERMRVNPALQGLTGQALIAEANAAQEADYRRNLRSVSQQTVDDFLGVTVNLETRDPNTPGIEQLVGAVNTYNNSLTEGSTEQQIRLSDRITPEQLARAALQTAGQVDALADKNIVGAASGRARQLLNRMVKQGLLTSQQEGKFFTLPPVDAEARAQRVERGEQFAQGAQPAPPTAEQAAATETLSLLTTASALSPEQLKARLAAVESRDPAVGLLARALTENLRSNTEETQAQLLEAINARLPAENQFEIREDDPNPARSLRMLAISELETRAGQQPATAMPGPDVEMRDTTRPDIRVWNPQESPEVIAAALANATGKVRAERERIEAEAQAARESMRPILEDVLRGRPPNRPMRWEDWQNAMEDYGAEISPDQAKQLNQIARQLGLLNGVNRPTVPPLQQAPRPQYDMLMSDGSRVPVEIVRDQPGVGVIVRTPDGNQILIPQEVQNQALIRRDQPTPQPPTQATTPAPTVSAVRPERETTFNVEQETQQTGTAAFTESASEPDARYGDERTTDEGPSFGRRTGERQISEYTEAEIQEAERIFRTATGPSPRLQFAQNLRLENLRGPVRAALEAENATLPAADRINEVSGYAIGDLVVLSLTRDNDFSLTDMAIHEGQHVAENLGLFTAQDIALLNANKEALLAGIRDKVSKFHYDQAELNPREMRAYAANAYVRGHRFNSVSDSIFAKLGRFLDRLANMVRGMGFQTVDDVYSRFVNGEMANRPAITPEQLSVATGIKATPTQTAAFRKWFGNSKIITPQGTPKILYHGTTNDFSDFIPSAGGLLGPGVYLTDSPRRASGYAGYIPRNSEPSPGGQVMPVYVSMQKPFDDAALRSEEGTQIVLNYFKGLNKQNLSDLLDSVNKQDHENFFDRISTGYYTVDSLANRISFNSPYFIFTLKQAGYDGIIRQFDYNNYADYTVFDSTQIKSALTNNGTFDPNDPRIDFGRKAPPGATRATPQETVQNYEKLGLISKWFASPTQMGRLDSRYSAVGDVQRMGIYATNEVTIEAERSMAPLFGKLTNEQLVQVHTIAEEANRIGRLPDYTNLPAPVAEALRGVFQTTNQIFNRFVDAMGHEYYMPTAAASPQQKAAIERMWAKHADKRLHEIPMADLQAANPEGAKIIAEIQRLRRPAYIPMMMSGSHYMAVYKKLPGGKKQLEKIAFFDPATLPQRMRGQNTEQYFRQQFEKLYPDRNQFEITAAAPARMNESREDVRAILDSRNAVDQFVQIFMNDLSGSSELKQRAAVAKKFLDKQQLARVFRPNDNKLLAIHDNNRSSYLLDALPQYALGAAKMYAHRLTERPFRDAIKDLQPADRQYFEQLRVYQSSPTEAFGGMRSFQFFWLLGGAIDTVMINALQPLQLTTPLMMRDGANMKHLADAYNVVGPSIFSLWKGGLTGINPDLIGTLNKRLANDTERKVISEMEKQGVFTPLYTNESRGQTTAAGMERLGAKNGVAAARFVNRLTGMLGSGQQAIEQLNRLVTFIAAYRAAQENPAIIERANTLDNRQYKTPADYAKGMVETSQFLITKEDRALIQRFHPVAEVATQFMSYPIKAIEQMVIAGTQTIRGAKAAMRGEDTFLLKAGAFSLIAQAAPLVMLGGVFALPLAEPLKELIELVWGSGTDLDRELRQFVMDSTGSPWVATAVARGIPHAADIANLSRRLALSPVEFNMLAEPTILNLLGPTGSFLENFWVIDENSPVRMMWRNGDYIGLSTLFTPRFVGNILRGSSLAAGFDQYTRQGNVIIPSETVEPGEAARVVFGFPPPRFTNMRDMVNAVEGTNRARTQRSQRDNMEAAGYYTQMLEALRDNNPQGVARAQERLRSLMQEIVEHNQRIFALAETNEQEFRRRLPEIRQWNATAIRNRALANYYGISETMPIARAANQTVRPQLDEMRQLYGLQ